MKSVFVPNGNWRELNVDPSLMSKFASEGLIGVETIDHSGALITRSKSCMATKRSDAAKSRKRLKSRHGIHSRVAHKPRRSTRFAKLQTVDNDDKSTSNAPKTCTEKGQYSKCSTDVNNAAVRRTSHAKLRTTDSDSIISNTMCEISTSNSNSSEESISLPKVDQDRHPASLRDTRQSRSFQLMLDQKVVHSEPRAENISDEPTDIETNKKGRSDSSGKLKLKYKRRTRTSTVQLSETQNCNKNSVNDVVRRELPDKDCPIEVLTHRPCPLNVDNASDVDVSKSVKRKRTTSDSGLAGQVGESEESLATKRNHLDIASVADDGDGHQERGEIKMATQPPSVVVEEQNESIEQDNTAKSVNDADPSIDETHETSREVFSDDKDVNDSASSWDGLGIDSAILANIQRLGFAKPTAIQRAVLSHCRRRQTDVVGAAETGSGKTLAFGIPLVMSIIRGGCQPVLKALVVTPTRELALQIRTHLSQLSVGLNVNIVAIVGGMSVEKQTRLLNACPQIVIGTPGRLWDLMSNSQHPHLISILPDAASPLAFLVVDEADRMTENAHFADLQSLIRRLIPTETQAVSASGRTKRCTFIMSATLPFVHALPDYVVSKKNKKRSGSNVQFKLNKVMNLLGINPKTAAVIDVTTTSGRGQPSTGLATGIVQLVHNCSTETKDYALYYFIRCYGGKTLVFCNSVDCVRRLVSLFGPLCQAMPLHGQMHQRQRLKYVDRFSAQSSGVLIASDVACRGIDIADVNHVIHYQVAKTCENYIHRSGRTARAGKSGTSLSLVDPTEMRQMIRIQSACQSRLSPLTIDREVFTELSNVVDEARILDSLQLQHKRQTTDKSWMHKMAMEADMIFDDDSDDEKSNLHERQMNKKRMNKAVKRQTARVTKLASQSLLSLNKSVFSGNYTTASGRLLIPRTKAEVLSIPELPVK